MSLLAGLIGNTVAEPAGEFAAILGASPSRGARSPSLWNAAYAAAGSAARMVPLDVATDRLAAVVAALKADLRFRGGAVTMPLKQEILPLLDRVEPEAQRIGAVNALYRDGSALVGANTDGAGALADILDLCPDLDRRRVLVLGVGGAGLAVVAFLAGRAAALSVWNRSPARAMGLGYALAAPDAEGLAGTDLLVNCTAAGHASGPAEAAFDTALLAHMPAGAAVYDVIYQPAETALLAAARQRGLATRNGLGMNRLQAVIAFQKANPGLLPADRIEAAMAAA